MSIDEFDTQVAWLGAQPSPSGGGGASTTQEPEYAEPEEHTKEPTTEEPVLVVEDELTPLPEPFSFVTDIPLAQEEETSPNPMPEPSLTSAPVETLPSILALEPEPTIQDSSAAPVSDLNEDHPQED